MTWLPLFPASKQAPTPRLSYVSEGTSKFFGGGAPARLSLYAELSAAVNLDHTFLTIAPITRLTSHLGAVHANTSAAMPQNSCNRQSEVERLTPYLSGCASDTPSSHALERAAVHLEVPSKRPLKKA